jgi:hypothetical protein
MRGVPPALKRRASVATGLLAVLALVGLPVEITIRLVEEPVIAPAPVAWLLLLGSCLLLLGSGVSLRRLAAARAAARTAEPRA